MSIINKSRMGAKPFSCLLAGLMVFGAAMCAQAASNWKGNGADTLWSTAANWDTVPSNGSGDSLAFRESNPPNKTATLDAA